MKVDQTGVIGVEGGSTFGILAQSIGGGGGRGGINVSGAGMGSTRRPAWRLRSGVGGTGGTGADSGAVVVASRGQIDVNRYTPDHAQPPQQQPDDIARILALLGLTKLDTPQADDSRHPRRNR